MDTIGLLPAWLGTRAYACDGARLGLVADVLFDTRTNHADWLVIALLRAGDRYVVVPAGGARQHPGGVMLDIDRELARTAPCSASPPNELGPDHARALAVHYGVRCPASSWAGIAEPRLERNGERARMRVTRAA